MNSENWRKAEELLIAALEMPPENRRKFIAGISADELRREVESLLEVEAEAENFLGQPALAFSAEFFEAEETLTDQRIGSYKIIGELGRGGMGAVYLAERADGKFQQKVAIKLLKRELNTADIRRRFAQERQILARLIHPNIARLLDAGTTDDGLPFLVMEYIEGIPINEYCERANLNLNECLKLFHRVCETIAFAHQNLIVHRDLKPSNILVTADGIPKLLDFGISKLLTAEFEAVSRHTITNLGAMTPEYASPEQIRGESVTTATDVYSLGVILYELLTKHRPFEVQIHSTEKIIQAICQTEPERPSSVVSSQLEKLENKRTKQNKQSVTNNGLRSGSLKGDLDNIVLKALKKDPRRRYTSVEQFAEDIRRHLANLPVSARPDTLSYRATKFINRNKFAVTAGFLIFLSLLTGIIATVWQSRRAEANQAKAERRFNDVRRLSNALLFELSPKIERLPGATEARDILVNRALEYLDSLAGEAEDDFGLQNELAAAYEKIGDLQGNPTNPNFIDSESAIKSYEKARSIRLKILQKNQLDFEQQRKLAENYRISGRIYGQANDFQNELKNLEAALTIYEKQPAGQSESIQFQLDLAQINHDIGRNRSNSKKYGDSFPFFKKAIALLEELDQRNPNQPDVQKLLADCHVQFAVALSWEERQQEAEAESAKAIEILEMLVARHPNSINLTSGLWTGYWLTSSIYEEVNNELSHSYALKALRVIEEIVRQDPANIRAKQQLAKSYSRLGQTLTNLDKPAEAVSHLEKARLILSEIIENRAKNHGLKTELTAILMRLGEAKSRQGLFIEAIGFLEQAVEIHQSILESFPADVRTLRNLALTHESIAEAHEKIAAGEIGQKARSSREMARNNYRKALDILLRLESQNSLAEFDRKLLERIRNSAQK